MRYKTLKYPTEFSLVLDNTKFAFHNHNNPLGHKKDGKCFVDKVEYNLNNPEYICYPVGFTQAQKKSFSRHSSQKSERLFRRNQRREKKKERNKENYAARRRYRLCDKGCGGLMTWCSICEVYSNNCCVDYGTCQCS